MTHLYSDNITRAILLAEKAHDGQMYNKEPYIMHPIRVSEILLRQGHTDENYIIVAYLHDVVEDTPVTLRHISKEFGDEIADAVDAITRRKKSDKYLNPLFDSKESEDHYLARVCTNDIARTVKFADMLDNLTNTAHVDCPDNKRKLWQKYVNAITVLKQYEQDNTVPDYADDCYAAGYRVVYKGEKQYAPMNPENRIITRGYARTVVEAWEICRNDYDFRKDAQ